MSSGRFLKRSTTDLSMDQTPLQYSTKYPPGYGDFALHCSDNVICHFPRYLLGYMSGFFKGMFELPNSGGKSEKSMVTSDPLTLTETSKIIELLLQHMDPKTQNLNLDPDTIVDLLEAARKYQVPTITEWYENEVQLKRTIVHTTGIPGQQVSLASESLLATDPLLVLYCALRFDLPRSGQLALNRFAQCDASLIKSTTKDVSLQAYLHGMSLRSERIDLFEGFIRQLTLIKWVHGRYPYSDTDRKACATCSAARAAWVFRLESAVCKGPSWISFLGAYEASGGKCTTCGTSSWADYDRDFLKDWEVKAKEVEGKLPAWPY